MKESEPLVRELGQLWASQHDSDVIDVVIVGSGYGGSVAAAGLAGSVDGNGHKLRVCVLERGRHWRPGEFPARFADLPGHVRLVEQNSGRVRGNAEGLFDMRLGDDVMALVGNGLGGGSLINAGVMLEPQLDAFSGERFEGARWRRWRRVLRALKVGRYFDQARLELGGTHANHIGLHPKVAQQPLGKTEAVRKLHGVAAAAALQPQAKAPAPGSFDRPPITVALADGPNHAGVNLSACTLCGDCMTGCNAGAKNSLDVNLLAKAMAARAEVYTGASVVSIKRDPAAANGSRPAHWVLRVAHTDPDLQAREKGLLYLRAHRVVLAAGSLGSTEILLRSRGESLRFSALLGQGFSCNGDAIAAVHRMPQPTHGSAEEDTPHCKRRVGPTITACFRLDDSDPRSSLVEEFSVPAPLLRVLEEAITTASALHALPDGDFARHGGESMGRADPLAVNPHDVERTLVVGLIGHDDAAGSLRLPQPLRPREGPPATGTLCIHWPQARAAAALEGPHDDLARLVARLGAESGSGSRLIANPLWRMLPPALESLVTQPRGPVLTVHPLGGCGLGSTVDDGVVDGCGRVFDGRPASDPSADTDKGRYDTLVVLDGAIVPTSLGVNPALTITALALRAVDRLRRSWQLVPAGAAAVPPAARPRVEPPKRAPTEAPAASGTTEVEIIERLSGPVWLAMGGALPRHCWVELTMAYKPQPLRTLMSTLERSVQVETASADTRLRIYDLGDWANHRLRVCSDSQRNAFVLFEAQLSGTLRFLHREPSSRWQRAMRGGFAWVLNRGLRDTWAALLPPRPRPPETPGLLRRIWNSVRHGGDLWNLASRAGEVRRFDYELKIGKVLHPVDEAGAPLVRLPGDVITGCKRLTYGLRANPWQQLTRLSLTSMPGLRDVVAPVLRLDTGFLAGIGTPLLRLRHQRDHASALADLACFGLYLTRVMLYVHLWSFRAPDATSGAAPRRLPGKVDGFAPQITELAVDRQPGSDQPVKIRLSRYPSKRENPLPPLLMIHGYSASGSTFTHDTLRPSAVEHFHRCGRDVWVLDLRSSAGMPTATWPWSFEQVALIDIPAALLHIRAVTGQPVDVLAHCVGAVMLAMAMLADARQIKSDDLNTGPDTWLSDEHLGQLAAFQGTPQAGREHPCIRRIVLSQKGPVLRYTDANVLRAYVLQSIRRVLLADNFQFRPPAEPTLTDELLDRLLASLPYPKADYDVENPRWPCATTGWTGTRHRMDALYGRAFSAANLRRQTLNSIDDLFGPMNLDTVAQTIHFARFAAITNQAGRGEFVTVGRLRERWSGVPTFTVHGEDNGLADVDTERLLRLHLRAANVPLRSKTYRGTGHQDLLIGISARQVFEDIESFLAAPQVFAEPPAVTAAPGGMRRWLDDRPWISPRIGAVCGEVGGRLAALSRAAEPPAVAKPPAGADYLHARADPPARLHAWVYARPWIGPRIVVPAAPGEPVRIAAMGLPDQGRARLLLLPAQRDTASGQCEAVAGPARLTRSAPATSAGWLVAATDRASLAGVSSAKSVPGWLALLMYACDETTASAPPVNGKAPARSPRRKLPHRTFDTTMAGTAPLAVEGILASPTIAAAPGSTGAAPPKLSNAAADRLQGMSDEERAACFVSFDDLRRVQLNYDAQVATPGFSFTVGSCQYPYGLIDQRIAGASLEAMGRDLDLASLALLVGDQIYADATAGLLDGTRRDERYDQPYDRALRLPALREVMRRVPVQVLPDDHELVDNWEPFAPQVVDAWPRAARERQQAREHGLDAFFKYQRMKRRDKDAAVDLDLRYAGYPFLLLDTRTRRSPRGSTVAAYQTGIISPAQWALLEGWLRKHRDEVKFVATGSLLLPRRRDVAAQPAASERSDTWDGFPTTLHRLLALIGSERVHRTVFLSGDEHHSLLAEVTLEPVAVKLVSIHASALYAPYPFANGRPHDFVEDDKIDLPGGLLARVKTTFAPAGDGYTRIDVLPGPPAQLHVYFHKATGRAEPLKVTLD